MYIVWFATFLINGYMILYDMKWPLKFSSDMAILFGLHCCIFGHCFCMRVLLAAVWQMMIFWWSMNCDYVLLLVSSMDLFICSDNV